MRYRVRGCMCVCVMARGAHKPRSTNWVQGSLSDRWNKVYVNV